MCSAFAKRALTHFSRDPALEVVINIEARRFHFIEKDGLRTQSLVFIASLFDESGNFVTGTELEVIFALKESTFRRMVETGLEMSVALQAPAGSYRMRGVAQDGVEGKAAALALHVPCQIVTQAHAVSNDNGIH